MISRASSPGRNLAIVSATLVFWTGALVQAVALVYALRKLASNDAPAQASASVKEATTQA